MKQNSSPARAKSFLRANIKNLISEYKIEQLNTFSLSICQQLRGILSSEQIPNLGKFYSKNIAVFESLASEPDIQPIVGYLLESGWNVVVPITREHGREEVNFVRLNGDADEVGDLISSDKIDVFVVPGLAFDKLGNRLGRGSGWYDQALVNRQVNSYAMAVCYPCQLVAEIPTEPHDQKVDLVIVGRD